MRYLQCSASITSKSGKNLDDLLINARAMGKCRYDLAGSLHHEHPSPR